MNKYAFALTVAVCSFSAAGAYAGGFGHKGSTNMFRSGGNTGVSSGLINISPSIGLGDVTALNNVLSGNAILSGNTVSGILNGNNTNVLSGILGTVGNAVSQGNHSYKLGRRY
jgi:hypothetical protein